jgi:hypothetical protein
VAKALPSRRALITEREEPSERLEHWPRQPITQLLRQRKDGPKRYSANHERPRSEWISLRVPAEVSALAQEQLERNKHHAERRTIEPTSLPGMLGGQMYA